MTKPKKAYGKHRLVCYRHRSKIGGAVMSFGECQSCQSPISSNCGGLPKLCDKCSVALGECAECREKLKRRTIRVEVTQDDINQGCLSRDGDRSFCCPVARALERASQPYFGLKMEDGSVSGSGRVFRTQDGDLYLELGHLNLPAPVEVESFVELFDDYDPGYPENEVTADMIQPFAFEIPDLDSGEWTEECEECHYFFPPEDLDGEGRCHECR